MLQNLHEPDRISLTPANRQLQRGINLENVNTVVYTDGACMHNGKMNARCGGSGVWIEANNALNKAIGVPGNKQSNQIGEITAVVAANDLIALGVLDALQAAGLSCPEQVSIVGHNDMPLVDLISPPLTTIRIEHREMGELAAKILIETINSGLEKVRHVILEPKLIVRKSTGTAKFRSRL